MKELVGIGCNQAGQIYINDSDRKRWPDSAFQSGNELPIYPYSSLHTPVVAMRAQNVLRILYTDWATLLVERDGELIIRGYAPHIYQFEQVREQLRKAGGQCELPIDLPQPYIAADVKKGFGNRYALAGLLMRDGKLLHFRPRRWRFDVIEDERFLDVIDIAYSLSGVLNVLRENLLLHVYYYFPIFYKHQQVDEPSSYLDNGHRIDTYENIDSMSSTEPNIASLDSILGLNACEPNFIHRLPPHHADFSRFAEVQGCASTFVALSSNGKLFTSGDPRHDSLGRPAVKGQYPWGLVGALDGMHVSKIAANPGSWLQLAMTNTGDVYIWGGKGDEGIKNLPSRSSDDDDDVGLVDLGSLSNDNGVPLDAEDIAVGCKHAMVVEKGGRRLWVAGKTDFGESGFGGETAPTGLRGVNGPEKDRSTQWRAWTDEMLHGPGRIVQVISGVFNTLVVIDRDDVTADQQRQQQQSQRYEVAGSGPRSSRRRRREDSLDATHQTATVTTADPWVSTNGGR